VFKFLFVLILILIALAMIAVRYRKQINSLIATARLLKEAKDAAQSGRLGHAPMPQRTKTAVHLLNCSKCGVWVPEDKSVRRAGQLYCSRCAT
jgi:formylmethanofuran dehydrogenase subunit E